MATVINVVHNPDLINALLFYILTWVSFLYVYKDTQCAVLVRSFYTQEPGLRGMVDFQKAEVEYQEEEAKSATKPETAKNAKKPETAKRAKIVKRAKMAKRATKPETAMRVKRAKRAKRAKTATKPETAKRAKTEKTATKPETAMRAKRVKRVKRATKPETAMMRKKIRIKTKNAIHAVARKRTCSKKQFTRLMNANRYGEFWLTKILEEECQSPLLFL